jgi:hypothetical protein
MPTTREWTVKEYARLERVSERTVWTWIAKGGRAIGAGGPAKEHAASRERKNKGCRRGPRRDGADVCP